MSDNETIRDRWRAMPKNERICAVLAAIMLLPVAIVVAPFVLFVWAVMCLAELFEDGSIGY